MVVDYLDILSVPASPAKNNAPLIVDTDRMISSQLAPERLHPVTGRDTQIAKFSGIMQIQKFAPRHPSKLCGEPPHIPGRFVIEKVFGEPVAKAFDHASCYQISITLAQASNR
jgi:hypothetical protein